MAALVSEGGLRLVPGAGAVLLMQWSGTTRPAEIRHRLTLKLEADPEPVVIDCGTASVRLDPVRLSSPVRGERWWFGNAFDSSRHHCGAVQFADGRVTYMQRFAVDLARKVRDTDGFSAGDPFDNRSHPSFDSEVLAVADARVIAVRDGMPDQIPYDIASFIPMNGLRDYLGNHVALDVEGGRTAVYAHLRQGSVVVQGGSQVCRGQAADGVPFVFDEFTHDSKRHRDEVPPSNWMVEFGRRRR